MRPDIGSSLRLPFGEHLVLEAYPINREAVATRVVLEDRGEKHSLKKAGSQNSPTWPAVAGWPRVSQLSKKVSR